MTFSDAAAAEVVDAVVADVVAQFSSAASGRDTLACTERKPSHRWSPAGE